MKNPEQSIPSVGKASTEQPQSSASTASEQRQTQVQYSIDNSRDQYSSWVDENGYVHSGKQPENPWKITTW